MRTTKRTRTNSKLGTRAAQPCSAAQGWQCAPRRAFRADRPRTESRRGFDIAVAGVIPIILGGCATTPAEPVSEKLDPNTATTVMVMNRPVELLSQSTHGAKSDPFAYIAPFETNRMGERALYLWVSAPQDAGPLSQPQVLCNGQPLSLQPLSSAPAASGTDGPPATPSAAAKPDPEALRVELSQLKLSHPPYDAPVPWSAQWYFRLPPDGLKCLASADGISLEARASGGDPERFTADRKNIASLDEFTRRY